MEPVDNQIDDPVPAGPERPREVRSSPIGAEVKNPARRSTTHRFSECGGAHLPRGEDTPDPHAPNRLCGPGSDGPHLESAGTPPDGSTPRSEARIHRDPARNDDRIRWGAPGESLEPDARGYRSGHDRKNAMRTDPGTPQH